MPDGVCLLTMELSSDAKPYAEFIFQHLLKNLPAFPGASRAVSETEIPIEGDNWYWADDNAKVLELLGHPAIWRERPDDVAAILEFLRALCDGPYIFRRVASPRFETLRHEGGDADFLHSLMNIHCELARGIVTLGMRFHDGRTARNVMMTANYVRFCHRGKVYTVDVEDHINDYEIEPIDGGVRLIWRSELTFNTARFKIQMQRLGLLTYTTTIRASTMFVDVDVALDIEPTLEISDVFLTFGYDNLTIDKDNVRYENIRAIVPNAPPILVTASGRRFIDLEAIGATYWCIAQKSQISGFALAVHSLPRGESRIHAIRAIGQKNGRLHSIVSEHKFSGIWTGARLVASERKIITSGGFYDEPESYAAILKRYSDAADTQTTPIDLSISYDYGAEVKAFARCFRTLSESAVAFADPALRDELRALVDRFHAVYQTHFILPYRKDNTAIFSRSIAFMAFAYVDMIAATDDPMYKAALREACEIILTFERQNEAVDGSIQSGFLMGQQNDALPYVDCHSSCLLALVRGIVLLDEPGWLPSIDRGLAAYRVDTIGIFFLGMQKQDVAGVDFKLPDGSRRMLDMFWNFNVGLTLRLFNALRTTPHAGLREIWERHWPRIQIIEMLMQHRLGRSLRQRGDAIEILSSMLSAETNSETQPWAALALIGEETQDRAA